MDNIAKLILITIKSLLKKNRGNKLFLMCAVLLMFIPTFLYSTTQSVMHQVERSYKMVFGNFTDIYYDTPQTGNPAIKFSNDDFEAILPGFHYERFGVFYTAYRQELNSSKKLNVGYADDETLSLAQVITLEGTLPKSDDEIALTQGVASLLGNKVLGGQVEIAGSVYIVSGIIQDFGHLWPRGESQIENNVGPVNAFVTLNEAGRILKKTEELTRQILVVRQLGISNPVEYKPNFFRNVNNSLENQKKFIVPNEFRVLIYSFDSHYFYGIIPQPPPFGRATQELQPAGAY